MVEEVKAWQAADGKLFATRLEATKHDAVKTITELASGRAGTERVIFNHASAMAMVENAEAIAPVLQQIVEATWQEPSDA